MPFAVIVVVRTDGIGIVLQAACEQSGHLGVRVSGHAGIELNPRLGQGIAGAAADTAADQHLRAALPQEARQGPVSAAVGIHHPAGDKLAVLHLVKLELLRMAKVLKDLSVFVSNRNFHHHFPPFLC